MQQFFSTWLCLFPLVFLSKGCAYTSISTRQHQVVFRYFGNHKSEKDLPLCSENSVCTVLHKRFWFPSIAERICRCSTTEECPWKWTDNKTMTLNNRAQLKFCVPVYNLAVCTATNTALTSVVTTNGTQSLNVSCFCPPEYHWRHSRTFRSNLIERDEYKCEKLKRCKSFQVCGHVRNDTSAIYYSCSCPYGHECVFQEKSSKYVEELLYKGQAFKAICEPTISDYDYE